MRAFRLPGVLFAATLALGAIAQSVTGVWHGKFNVDTSGVTRPTDPAARKAMEDKIKLMGSMIAKAKLTLTLKPDKTFQLVAENVPGTTPKDTVTGTYTKTGQELILITKMDNGKAPTGNGTKPQKVAIENGGKRLVMLIQNASAVKVSIVYSR
jgi:hypothetical protein